jgi:glycosyltransferase involved in cell wall biosynthesis
MSKKVVHVLGSMNAGGVEAWLMALLRNTNQELINHEFIVHSNEKAFYDDEIYRLGSQIHYCYKSSNLLIYMLDLYKKFKKIKPDVVHSHVHTFTGLVLLIAFLAGVKVRVAHSHSDTRVKDKSANFLRRSYLKLMRYFISKFSNKKLAVSQLAAECLYGDNWKFDKRVSIIFCGVDEKKFDNKYYNSKMRKELGFPQDSYIIGHVGRFCEPKNHEFLIDVFYNIRKNREDAYLLLVGDGELRTQIEKKVEELNLHNFVKFLGLRKDVNSIMLSSMDILAFPSLWEGLPITLIEAQLGKLHVIASSNITNMCDLGLVEFVELDLQKWITALVDFNKSKENYDFEKSKNFMIGNNISILKNIYQV